MRTLFAITQYNEIKMTRQCLSSLEKGYVDLLIVDDASEEDITNLAEQYQLQIITKEKGMGLTHSWNLAYKKFRDEKYDTLILANNDILVPLGALKPLLNLCTKHTVVVPLSTRHGSGHGWKHQAVSMYYRIAGVANPSNYQAVQSQILKQPQGAIKIPFFNGFFFAMNRNILKYELDDGNLFKPENINVGNEDDLNDRLSPEDKPTLCLDAFIFHFKNQTFKCKSQDSRRNQLSLYRKSSN